MRVIFVSGLFTPLCENMTSSIKLKVLNVSHCHQRRNKPWPQLTCVQNFLKVGCVVLDIREQTDRQYDRHKYRHADCNILHPYWGGVTSLKREWVWCYNCGMNVLTLRQLSDTLRITSPIITVHLNLMMNHQLKKKQFYGMHSSTRHHKRVCQKQSGELQQFWSDISVFCFSQ